MTTLLLALALQDASLEPFYKFKTGSAWTYKRVEGSVERRIEAKAEGEENGRVRLEWREVNLDGTLYKKSQVAWFVKEGVLRVEASSDDGAFEVPLLKAGVKKDETWTNPEGESVFLGSGELKVAAGAYPDAHHVRLKLGGPDAGVNVDVHLAPKVGFLKISVASPDGPNTFELLEFKEAK